jgi:magnesium chelatase family protein
MIRKYWSRISGPLLDRIDIHVEVPAIEWRDLTSIADGEPSEKVRARVDAARVIQLDRLKKAGIYCNAQMRAAHIKKFCALGSDSLAFLERAVDKLGLSARAYHRILKIARTIADLESAAAITTGHVGEAVQYRSLDRRYRS